MDCNDVQDLCVDSDGVHRGWRLCLSCTSVDVGGEGVRCWNVC